MLIPLGFALGAEPEGDAVIAALRKDLSDGSPDARAGAAAKLWELEEPAESLLPTLIDIICEYRPAANPRDLEILRCDSAIELVGRIGPESKAAVPALTAALASPQFGERLAAAEALAEIGPDAAPAIEQLAKALRDTETQSFPFVHRSWCVSDGARLALWRIGPASRMVLIVALSDKDEYVRVNAAIALGYLPPDKGETVAALVKLLDDPSEGVRANAAFSLGRIGSPATSAVPQGQRTLNRFSG